MKIPQEIKVMGFDCDGVLFDSMEANKAYYNILLDHFGLPALSQQQIDFLQSHTVEDSLTFLLGEEISTTEIHAFRRQMDYQPILDLMKIEPHAKRLLEKLRLQYKTALATNRTDTIEKVLDGYDLRVYFDLVVCSLDVKRPKPHPDMLHKVMDHFRIGREHLLYIGDSILDQQAAKAAGIFFVAFDNAALSADLHIKSFKEFGDIAGVY